MREVVKMINDDGNDVQSILRRKIRGDYDFIASLPEEVQEQVNKHADEFNSFDELRKFVLNLERRA